MSMFYEEFPGDAPRLVYVHGLGGCHLNWTDLAAELKLQAIAPDLPGFGRTPSAGRRTDVQANAAVLRDFLRDIGGGQSILVGGSMGGLISAMVAVSDPDLVRGVVLVNPVLPLVEKMTITPAARRRLLLQGLPLVGEISLSRRYATVPVRQRITEVLQNCCIDPSRVSPGMVESLVMVEEELSKHPRRHAADYLGASRSLMRQLARPAAYWDRLQAIKQPVLLIHGNADRLIPVASARAAAQRFPHWTYAELEAGHTPSMETPHLVAAEIARWLPQVN